MGLAIVDRARFCLVLFGNLPPFSQPLFLECNAFEVSYERSDLGAGWRQWALWLLGVTVDLDLLFGYL